MQNTPPGAWEAALFNRVPTCGLRDMERLLDEDKALVQAWSMRGAPVVFPTSASAAFLGALVPQGDEPWIYTRVLSSSRASCTTMKRQPCAFFAVAV